MSMPQIGSAVLHGPSKICNSGGDVALLVRDGDGFRVSWEPIEILNRTVIGEPRSGASDLVTALLDDPLGASPETQDALHARRRTDDRPLLLERDDEAHTADITDGLPLSCSFLTKHGSDVLEFEGRTSSRSPGAHRYTYDQTASSAVRTDCLYQSDHVLVVVDRQRGTSPVRDIIARCGLQARRITIVGSNFRHGGDPLHAEVDAIVAGSDDIRHSHRPEIVHADLEKGLDALDLLRDALSVGRPAPADFQAAYTASRLIDVEDVISKVSARSRSSNTGGPAAYQLATAAFVAEMCASDVVIAASALQMELDHLAGRIADLDASVHAAKRHIAALLQVGETGMVLPQIMLEDAREAVQSVFRTRVPWWKLPFGGVDDVRIELRAIVENAFLRAFESKLFFDAGQLDAAASLPAIEATMLLESRPFNSSGPLHSPVLLNTIAQLESRRLAPDCFARSIVGRRRQLASRGGPLDWTQRRAQFAVLRAYTLSSLIGGAGAVLWSADHLSASTALGMGTFGLAVSAYVLQKAWAKTERRLLEDWKRVETGLGYDLKDTLELVLRDVVFAKAEATVTGLGGIIAEQQNTASEVDTAARDLLRRATDLHKSLSL